MSLGLGESGRPARLGNRKGAELPKELGRPAPGTAPRPRASARTHREDPGAAHKGLPGRENTSLISWFPPQRKTHPLFFLKKDPR